MSAFLAVRPPLCGQISTVYPKCVPPPVSGLSATKGLDFVQDINIVVSGDSDGIWEQFNSEEIKETIVRADDRYFLEPSRRPRATHHTLYCRLPRWRTNGRRVKVDILVPPTLGLPEVHNSEVHSFNGIPVMPIFDPLVMKTGLVGQPHLASESRRPSRQGKRRRIRRTRSAGARGGGKCLVRRRGRRIQTFSGFHGPCA
jgi:hypothetical protein